MGQGVFQAFFFLSSLLLNLNSKHKMEGKQRPTASQETVQDGFAFIAEFSRPTASQEARFPKYPFARESDIFARESMSSDDLSSSPERAPIVMVSPPKSVNSTQKQAEDDAIFHTPPEHNLPSYFSAEDQNPDGSSPDGAWPVDRIVKSKDARSSQVGLGDKIVLNVTRVPTEEIPCVETVPADETEAVADESEVSHNTIKPNETMVSVEAFCIKTDETEAVDDEAEWKGGAKNSNDVSVDIDVVRITHELQKDDVPKDNNIHGNHSSSDSFDDMEIMVNKMKIPLENSHLDGRLGTPNGARNTTGNALEQGENIHGHDKGERSKAIDEFRHVREHDGQECPKRTCRGAGGFGSKRHLPVLLEGGGKRVGGLGSGESVEVKRGLLAFKDLLRVLIRDKDGGSESDDFLETAKRRGLTFPRPRWWLDE